MKNVDLRHIAKLSRLEFTEAELKMFESQVAQILSFVERLSEVPVEGIEPTSHPLALLDVFREDVPQPSLDIESFLAKAPKAHGRFFEVPKIIEDPSAS